MFSTPGSSDFDLNFRLLGFPIQVSPSFWLSSVLLGWPIMQASGGGPEGFLTLATWVGVVFISILVHELGHALAARSLGYRPYIHLYFMGGAAFSEIKFGWRQFYVAAAGPLAGFLLFALCYFLVLFRILPDSQTIQFFFWINLVWTIFNLFPIYPLDGGQMLQGFTQAVVPRWSISITHTIGALGGALGAIYFFTQKNLYMAVMLGLLCMTNIEILQANRR